jgi:hypothetical protein
VAFWRAKKVFRSAAHAETARAFELDYAARFEPWGVELVVEPTRRGLFRETGEGAWLDLGKEGRGLDATFELAERRRGKWVELVSPDEFARQLRGVADEFLNWLGDGTQHSGDANENKP